jgi:hypothetical protein
MPDNFDDGADYSGFPPEDQAWFRENQRQIDRVSKESGGYAACELRDLIEQRRERWFRRELWVPPAHWGHSSMTGREVCETKSPSQHEEQGDGQIPGTLEVRREKSFDNPPHWKSYRQFGLRVIQVSNDDDQRLIPPDDRKTSR